MEKKRPSRRARAGARILGVIEKTRTLPKRDQAAPNTSRKSQESEEEQEKLRQEGTETSPLIQTTQTQYQQQFLNKTGGRNQSKIHSNGKR